MQAGTDDTTLLASISGISISDPTSPIFLGYQGAAGIGMVQIQSTVHSWSPLIDDLTFATVPEPSVSTLIVTGGLLLASTLVRRNRGHSLPDAQKAYRMQSAKSGLAGTLKGTRI
jgi:hypothetical protein